MMIPNFPLSEWIQKTGNDVQIHPEVIGVFRELLIALQQNLSNEGIQMPPQNTSVIQQLNTNLSMGRMLYNNQTHEFVGNVNGVFQKFEMKPMS